MTNSWYTAGSVTMQNNSTLIKGIETYWLEADIKKGDGFLINNILCEISEIRTSTEIVLARAYTGESVQGAAYAIIPRAPQVLAVNVLEEVQTLTNKIKEQESKISEIVAYAAKFKKAGLGVDANNRIYQGPPEPEPAGDAVYATDAEIDALINDVYSH